MAKWMANEFVGHQFNLVSGDNETYIGQLYWNARTDSWKMYCQKFNCERSFKVPRDQPDSAKHFAAEWMVEVFERETKWMREAAETLKVAISGFNAALATISPSVTPPAGQSSS